MILSGTFEQLAVGTYFCLAVDISITDIIVDSPPTLRWGRGKS